MFQANLSQYLSYAKGYIEHQDEIYDVIFEDLNGRDRENVKLRKLNTPTGVDVTNSASGSTTYSYKITAVNSEGETLPSRAAITIEGASDLSTASNTVSWDAVAGADSYNVYGRTPNSEELIANTSLTNYPDNGSVTPNGALPAENTATRYWVYSLPVNRDYMSIPTLSGMNTGTVYSEGTEYDILNLDSIRFNSKPATGSSNLVREKFVAQQGISLLPSILRFYFKSIGMEEPKDVINNLEYTPKIENWGAQSYLDQRKDYCVHLKYLTYGIVSNLRKEPTITNLKNTYGLIMDYPFAYEAGEVTSVAGQVVTISGANGVYSYDLNTANVGVSVSEQVEQFEILATGLDLIDYVEDPVTVSGFAPKRGEELEFDAFIATNTPSKDRLEVLTTQSLSTFKNSDKLTFVNKSGI